MPSTLSSRAPHFCRWLHARRRRLHKFVSAERLG
jgi:hypothetical protein